MLLAICFKLKKTAVLFNSFHTFVCEIIFNSSKKEIYSPVGFSYRKMTFQMVKKTHKFQTITLIFPITPLQLVHQKTNMKVSSGLKTNPAS